LSRPKTHLFSLFPMITPLGSSKFVKLMRRVPTAKVLKIRSRNSTPLTHSEF